jgi:hypothetical protein
MHIKMGVAGLSDELELRLSLARRLLSASEIHIDVQDWKGTESDILIADLDNSHGRLAYQMATRQKLPVLAFARSDGEGVREHQLERQTTAGVLARVLREKLQAASASSSDELQGLLGIFLQEAGCTQDLLVRRGGISFILRHAAGRILGRSVSDLSAVEARMLEGPWLCTAKPAVDPYEHEWLVSRSLDGFLIKACLKHHASLPPMDENLYRLTRWPDLGSVTDDQDALRLSALLQRSAWTAETLSNHTGVCVRRIHAFFWATLASGALAQTDSSMVKPVTQPPATSAASTLQRIARHFGLLLGYSHA